MEYNEDILQDNDFTSEKRQAAIKKYADDYGKILNDYKEILPELATDFQKTIEESLINFTTTIDEAVEAVKKENPIFKDISFEQLKNNKEFQQALKDYMITHSLIDRKSTRLNSSHSTRSRMPSSA
jgi:hypothetical protein